MTFSVLALDRATGAIGGAAATGNLAVGAWVLRAAARVGAVATQGCVSPLWGDDGLAMLARGAAADEVVAALTEPDTGRDHRQLAVLDASGRAAAWTGESNTDAKGHIIGSDFVIAGNMLSDTAVLNAMETAYTNDKGDFGRRLLATLEAAVAAGSDARGTSSAAIRVVRSDQPPLDLRIDYDDDPLGRLLALYDIATNPPYSDWIKRVPTLEDPYRR